MPAFIAARSLGPTLEGSAPCIPSCNDSHSFVLAVYKRVGRQTPPILGFRLRELRSYVRVFLRNNFEPLSYECDVSREGWLKRTHYSEKRKQELRDADDGLPLSVKDYICKTHMKLEVLAGIKHVRIINSRSDKFKVFTGPIFKQIEDKVFSTKWFIKHIPVNERMKFLVDRLKNAGRRYAVTDYTSFESHMTPQMMHAVEFQLYDYMTQNLPFYVKQNFMKHVKNALGGTQHCQSKFGSFTIKGTRMSGDMCTSLGNGFTNMMLCFYLFNANGFSVDGVFEGDDGLLSVGTKQPMLTEKEFKQVGGIIKLNEVGAVEDAEFCGMFCAEGVNDNLGDIVDVLTKFGWTMSHMRMGSPRVCMGLLRAKAFSLAYEFPRCPILRSLAEYALRVTRNFKARFDVDRHGQLGWWDQQVLADFEPDHLPDSHIDQRSREAMERKYHISVALQIKYEKYFEGKSDLHTIPNFGLDIPECNAYMNSRYVFDVPKYCDISSVRWKW